MVPRLPVPHINPLNILLCLRFGTLEGASFGLKACSFSLHFLSLKDILRKENLRRSLMNAFRTVSALASFICRARLVNTSSTPMSSLADVSRNGHERVVAIFLPSRYVTSRSSSKSHYGEQTSNDKNAYLVSYVDITIILYNFNSAIKISDNHHEVQKALFLSCHLM